MPRSYINIGAFAKYPLKCGEHVKIFPLMGLDYAASISGKIKYSNPEANALSSLWFKFGGGIDFDMGKTIYLRSELIYGLRAANTFEHFCADRLQSDVEAKFGQEFGVKIGVGARF